MTYDLLTVDPRNRTRSRTAGAPARTKRLGRRADRHAARLTLADWMLYE
jgi:hypothetical protein